jgi:Tol biopolymer transport system component
MGASVPERELWDMKEDGTDLRQLTANDVFDGMARYSRDGRFIVFSRARFSSPTESGWKSEIHIMNADGTGVRRVAESLTDDWYPTLSPDGTRIAFLSYEPQTPAVYHSVYVVDMNGSNRRMLSPPEYRAESAPEWSPDGTKILFQAWGGPEDPGWAAPKLYLINADGTGLRMLPDPCGAGVRHARWSPDGMEISVMCVRSAPVGQKDWPVYIMSADGGNVRRISPELGHSSAVMEDGGIWSPDGKRLLVSRLEQWPTFRLYTVDLTTAGMTEGPAFTDVGFEVLDWRSGQP